MRLSGGRESAGKLVFLGLGFAVGALVGAGTAWVAILQQQSAVERGGAAQRERDERAARERAATPIPGGDALARPEAAADGRTEVSARVVPGLELFGDVQRAYGREGIERGWAREREDAVPEDQMSAGLAQYEELVRNSPEQIGRELARRRTKAEQALRDSQSGGVLSLLEALAAGGAGPVNEVVRDVKQFDALFPRQLAETVVDGPASRPAPDKQVENGVTLSFPAGVFALKHLMQERDPFPSDVTLAGAGMNATLLVLDQAMSTRGPLVRFGIRDCTVHTQGHDLLDLRLKPASLVFERARFVGFDSGAGGSDLLSCVQHGFALRATDCRFEGGYGPHPWSCNFIDVRNDALIARFDRCRFDQMTLEIWRWTPGVTVRFSGCTMIDLLDMLLVTEQAATKPGVSFDGCSFTYFGPTSETHAVPAKDLNVIFPNWRQRMQ